MSRAQNQPRSQAAQGRFRLRQASAGDILRDAFHNFKINGDANQAAAIALYAILSFIPLFILTLLMVDNLFSADPEIRGKLIEVIRQFIPSFSGELITQVGRIEKKKEVLGWVGIISLIWFSAMIFGAIEKALNFIFRARTRRKYYASKLLAIAMIPMGWTVGVGSVGITYVATIVAGQPILGEGGFLFFNLLRGALFRYLLPYLVTVLFITVVYKAIPLEKIKLKSAVIGSAIFSALMEIAKQFFTWYVANYTRYNVIFGSLEAVVILVIWVFYISLIFLFCAELIASYERHDMLLIEKALLKPKKGRRWIDERLFRKFGRPYAPGEYIFREGDMGQELFYILGGRVRMEKSAGQIKKVLAEMGPGEYFGEMAALIHSPRTASARCLEASDIAVIGGDMLRRILRENPDVALFMLREFSNRIRHTNEALEGLTRTWIRLMVTLYFFRSWPLAEDRNPVEDLIQATAKEPEEIREILGELDGRGVLTYTEGRVAGFNREEALRFLDEQVRPL